MDMLTLTSPMQGWAASLNDVPDPVFAERMMGDGLAIDPTGDCLHAPCDGVVLSLPTSGHAITLRSPEGVEILIHIGLDTVALGGRGFTAHVCEGGHVRRGDPLITFDLDLLVCDVRSVITPVIVTNLDRFAIVQLASDRLLNVGDMIMTIAPTQQPVTTDMTVSGSEVRRPVEVPLIHGIHARPAARIGEVARHYSAAISIMNGERRADARSPVALMTLGILRGDNIMICASGPDAAVGVDAIVELIMNGMDESADCGPHPGSPPIAAPSSAAQAPPAPAIDGQLSGITASPGIAIGQAGVFRLPEIAVSHDGVGVTQERAALDDGIATVAARLASRATQVTGTEHAIVAAHQSLLQDPSLLAQAQAAVDGGDSAIHAWHSTIRRQADVLRATGGPHLAERADDLLDLEHQVIRAIAGEKPYEPVSFPPDTILLADDLLPSHLIGIDTTNIAGLCVERGGPTSHVAILATAMGLPALVGLGPELGKIEAGTALILDADAGILHIAPTSATQAQADALLVTQRKRRTAALATADQECRTSDGVRIKAFANVGSLDDAKAAIRNGAEGCGLLRTEFLFLDRQSAPDISEQAADYQRIADVFDGRPLIVRLLDIGGDKAAPYLPLPVEDNPALGLRGIRVGIAHPDLLDAQLRAILSVRPAGQCRIMVPMVTSMSELRAVRTAIDRAVVATSHIEAVELGIMVETPAAALTAGLLAKEADFLSIGTNDLTQYTLAMDRTNPAVAAALDGLHPAVLRLIAQTCSGGAQHGRWTGVCGGLASDPIAIPILLGLGVTELSCAPAMLPDIKALVATFAVPACKVLAQDALSLASAADVRALVREFRA